MKNKIKRICLLLMPLFFVVAFSMFFNVQQVFAANDCGTAAFKPDWKCTDINGSNNIFNPSTACVTGHCDGGANIQCCRQDCDPGETCMDKAAGLTCVSRGVCSGSRACCKPSAGGGGGATSGNTNTGSGTSFENPLRFASVDQLLSQILGVLQKIIVTLSLLMIVYGAVLYVTSAGGKQIDTAKNAITSALVGLAIGIAAPSFLKEIAGILGWGTSDTRLANAMSLTQIATNVLNFLLGILGILSLIMMVYGASLYLTSAGDGKKAEEGKNVFKYSIIGVILAMASMVLVSQVARLFVAS